MREFDLDNKNRNIYVKMMVNILFDKYYISRPKIARKMGLANSYLADFSKDRMNAKQKNLDIIESFINDLYGGIIRDEIAINRIAIDKLIEDSKDKNWQKKEPISWLDKSAQATNLDWGKS